MKGEIDWTGRRPPPVEVRLPAGTVPAVLLAWARIGRTGGWAAGIAYLYRTWHSRALVTVWVPARLVEPSPQARHAAEYRRVPRVDVAGPPTSWTPLPAVYPGASAEWIETHRHCPDYRQAPV